MTLPPHTEPSPTPVGSPSAAPLPVARGGMPAPLRHLVSILGALVLTPLGIGALDKGALLIQRYLLMYFRPTVPASAYLWLALGSVVLVVSALLGRLSPLGPIIAGVVWGLIPSLLFLRAPKWYYPHVHDVLGKDAAQSTLIGLPVPGLWLIGVLLVAAGLVAIRRR